MTEVSSSPLRQRVIVILAIAAVLGAVALLALRVGDGGAASPAVPPSDVDPYHVVADLSGPLITEIMSSNASTVADADGDFSDWIELHNPTDQDIALGGYYLSDDDDRPDRWEFPDVTLEPGGYLVVFASGKDRTQPAGELHTSFRLAQEGEPTLLVAPDGVTIVDRLPSVEVPRDASLGRDPHEFDRVCYFAFATPGDENVPECFDDRSLGAPSFSATSGFYDAPIEVEVLSSTGDVPLIYTLDGSYPDPSSESTLTLQPGETLSVDGHVTAPPDPGTVVEEATVVRARSTFSRDATAVYFIGSDAVRPSLPVMHLALDREHLFDHDVGIYVEGRTREAYLEGPYFDPDLPEAVMPANFNQRGREWERPALDDLRRSITLHYFDPGGELAYESNVGLRVHGGVTRAAPMKSLRLYARNDYGTQTFEHRFFGEDGPAEHRRLILRNSGNDRTRTMLLDGFTQSLVEHLDVETQAYQPTALFINGQYWGVHNLRERYDAHYLAINHGVHPDDVTILEPEVYYVDGRPQFRQLQIRNGSAEDRQSFLRLLDDLQAGDASSPEMLARVEEEIDVDDLIDYLIVQMFTGNTDWPHNNVRMWRESIPEDADRDPVTDGRWRWLVFDLDHLGRNRRSAETNHFEWLESRRERTTPEAGMGIPVLYGELIQNEAFRHRFRDRFHELLDTAFDPARTTEELSLLTAILESEIGLHTERWGRPSDVATWWEHIEELERFYEARPDVKREHLIQHVDEIAPG